MADSSTGAPTERISPIGKSGIPSLDQFRFMETALDCLDEGVVVTDADLEKPGPRILYVNQGFTRITGYAPSQVLGRNPRMMQGPKTDRQALDKMRADLKAGRIASGETVNYRQDGSEFILSWKIFPVRSGDGLITNYIAIQRDISHIRKLEEDLFQSQKMEAIGRLAGGIAHDFNNLLAVILSFSEMMIERATPEAPEQSFLQEIHKAANRAAELTTQLMAFSRRQAMEPEILDVKLVIGEMNKILRRIIPENIHLNQLYTDDPLYVLINRTSLEQMLINLMTNARDALPDGGTVTIQVTSLSASESVNVLPESMVPRPYAVITFRDNGVGMDADTASHVFEPFFTTKPIGKGTGLGLSTIYGMLKQADGHIDVSSEPGQGTVFSLYLPVAETNVEIEAEQTPVESTAQPSSVREPILVVEDDENMCDCITGLLGLYNYEVFSTNSAEDALEQFEHRSSNIRLLITDLVLPKMKGSDLAHRLLTRNPEMKVVYMTGYGDDAVPDQIEPSGVALLRKPFSLNSVLRIVQESLGT